MCVNRGRRRDPISRLPWELRNVDDVDEVWDVDAGPPGDTKDEGRGRAGPGLVASQAGSDVKGGVGNGIGSSVEACRDRRVGKGPARKLQKRDTARGP